MKKRYSKLSLAVILSGVLAITTKAQVNNVGIGTKNPDESAVLDIQSPDKGLLIPRMTIEQRNAIAHPADGLMIYQTGKEGGFFYFNGKTNIWSPLSEKEAKVVAAANADNWSKTGDSGTNPANNFVGTTDGNDLVLRANNLERVRIGINGVTTIQDNINSYGTLQLSSYSNDFRIEGGANAGIMSIIGPQIKFVTSGGLESFRMSSNGNVGINTVAPSEKLHVVGNIYTPNIITAGQYLRSDFYRASNNNLLFSYGNFPNEVRLGSGDPADYTAIYSGAVERIKILQNGETQFGGSVKVQTVTGHLAVGDFTGGSPLTTPAGYRMIVQDGILTEKIKVALKTTGDWADYVFEPSYKLMSLEEVEAFTQKNKHLPNVPSANEMAENGLDVSHTSKIFMEKIEELTLYMIELNKEVKSLKAENEALKARLN